MQCGKLSVSYNGVALCSQLVLARAGFDLTREKRNLDKIDLSTAYEDFEPASDQNLERYLDYQHSLLVNSLIEENNNKVGKIFS